MPKFICVKAIIFLTFWQGILLALLVWAGLLQPSASDHSNNMALELQNIILCYEMPLFAWMHYYAFPWTDYDDSRLSSRLTITYAIRDALGLKDIIQDTRYTFFAPPTRQLGRVDETTPIRSAIYPRYSVMLEGDTDSGISLAFHDPEDEEEADYDSGRRLVFGDFNFPVLHEDPNFHYPPIIQQEVQQHMQDFQGHLQGKPLQRRKEFDSREQIEDRLLQWDNASRHDTYPTTFSSSN